MQALVQTKVPDDEKKLAVLGMLADKYSRLILQATIDKPRSAMEISAEKKIPISSVYRRCTTAGCCQSRARSAMTARSTSCTRAG